MFTVSVSAVGNSIWYSNDIIFNLYQFYYFTLICVNLLNMFTKHGFKLEMFLAVFWSYGKLCILIVRTVSLVNHSVLKVWILPLLYKLSCSFIDIFRLKKSTCMQQFMFVYWRSCQKRNICYCSCLLNHLFHKIKRYCLKNYS